MVSRIQVKDWRRIVRFSAIGAIIAAFLGGILWIGSALIQPPPMRPIEYYANVTVLGPTDRTIVLGDEDASIRFLITGVRGLPKNGEPVTFTVTSGPAEFPDGIEKLESSSQGVAETQSLEITGTGTFTISVEIELVTKEFEFTVIAP